MAGIDAARHAGLNPVKINMVVQRGVNEHCIIPMAEWARREGLELRFIEYMDVGCSNGWTLRDVVPAAEITRQIDQQWPLTAVATQSPNETADRYRYVDGRGHIGIVASITRPFCGNCTRARISSRGEFYPCLFAPVGYPLAPLLEQRDTLRAEIARLWHARTDRYSELRATSEHGEPRAEMYALGG